MWRHRPRGPPTTVRFDYEKLSAGHAKPCESEGGSELVSLGVPRACTMRIVDPETRVENPAGKVGEIWLHGHNIAGGYWRNPQLSEGPLVDGSSIHRPKRRRSPGFGPEIWGSCPRASCSSSAGSKIC